MENPATWGKAERVVSDVLRRKHEEDLAGEFQAGLSTAKQITNALRQAGLLRDEDD